MVEEQEISWSLEVNVGKADSQMRRIYAILGRSAKLIEDMSGGNRGLRQLGELFDDIAMKANSARLAFEALALARAASGDPTYYILAGFATINVASSFIEMEARRPNY